MGRRVQLNKKNKMNYKFLAKEEITKFFEESELSVGEIVRALTQEKFTGVKIENRNRLSEISDKEWYEIIEKVFEYEQE